MVTSVPACPGYFDSLQIPLLKGRLFTDADSATAPLSVILNREGAKRFFGDEDPIGRTLPFGKQQLTVVGVVENVRYTGVAGPNESAHSPATPIATNQPNLIPICTFRRCEW